MVADNKQPTSKEETLSLAQVGDGGQTKARRRFRVPRIAKKQALIALLVVLLVLGGGLVIKKAFHIGDKVYAQAAGHKVYKSDTQDLIGKTKGVSDHDAAVVLANKYLTEAMAKEAGITVTDKDLTAQYGTDINKQKTKSPYAYQANVNTVYFNKLIAYNAGFYQGKLLVANFSRHIAFESPFLDIQKATDPLMGNPAAVAADKTYAHTFITKLYNQVKDHKMTFDQAIQAEHNDPVVGQQAYPTLAHSGPFDTSDIYLPATALIAPESIKPKIGAMKPGELSKPFVVSVNNSLTNEDKKTDSYYLVVHMDSSSGGHSGLNYDQYLAKAKKQLGYKIYV